MAFLHHVERPRYLVPQLQHSILDATSDYRFDNKVFNSAVEQIQSAQTDVLFKCVMLCCILCRNIIH